ncbi:MAG TPA: hypothetical protein PKH93_14490 [Chitinophagales bacterium]|nr:hypothetical protein [Chitinophagales bacterium]
MQTIIKIQQLPFDGSQTISKIQQLPFDALQMTGKIQLLFRFIYFVGKNNDIFV